MIAAYIQWAIVGLPTISADAIADARGPVGFPAWLRTSHYINLFLMIVLIRSGLQILMDHPRLYWNVHSTPGTEWIRFASVEVPRDRLYTAKEDSRYLSPVVGLPGWQAHARARAPLAPPPSPHGAAGGFGGVQSGAATRWST